MNFRIDFRHVIALSGAIAVVAGSGPIVAAAGKPGKQTAPQAMVHRTPVRPDVVNSKTIYDDGDGTSDVFFFPPVTTTGAFQDDWMLVRGDVVSTTPAPPFQIETLSYFLRQNWNSTNGTVAVWAAGALTDPFFLGSDPAVHIGFNHVTLTTPLTISSVGLERWWMGIWQSFSAASPASECTSCRVVGVDNVGVNAPNVGFFTDIDAVGCTGASCGITSRTALGGNRVPIIRAGITATAVTVPVELLEFKVQ